MMRSSNNRLVLLLSLLILITACSSSSRLSSADTRSSKDGYWYCMPAQEQAWRCAEEAAGVGFSKPPAEEIQLSLDADAVEEETETAEEPADVVVKGIDVKQLQELSRNSAIQEPEPAIRAKDALAEAVEEQPKTSVEPSYDKVLQLAAYNSHSKALAFVDSVNKALATNPSLVRTQVNGKLYYTIVFEQLQSQDEAQQLIRQLKEGFPAINPWLRSRSSFNASRAD